MKATKKPKKNPHAVALGRLGGRASIDALDEGQRKKLARLGGLAGGKARAAKLTPAERKKIATAAALKRWADQRKKQSN